MANKSLFQSIRGRLAPKTNAPQRSRWPSLRSSATSKLSAQYASTGCLNGTFYASAEVQLEVVLKLCDKVAPEFIARTALYARQRGFMKDLPALLCAVLSVKSPGLLAEVFDRVIDSPKMLRNFVQIMRSGVVGRRSLGTLPKRLVRQWLDARSDDQLFIGSVGNDPSLADVVKMVHPTPATPARAALFGYLIGRAARRRGVAGAGPPVRKVQAKHEPGQGAGAERAVPDVDFVAAHAERLAADCPECLVADDAHEPQHVRASRCVRRRGSDGARGESAA